MSSHQTIEGLLLMADFSHDIGKCRIYPSLGEPIDCVFKENLEEAVYEHLRKYVRVTGETQEDAVTGRMKSININGIEPISQEGAMDGKLMGEEFWQEKSLEELAEEQTIQPMQRLDDILGHGAAMWENDEEFDEFLISIGKGEDKTA